MARIRTIKPDFFRHGGLFDAEQETGLPLRIAFAGLWTACDREGRFCWKPRELKLDALPHDAVDFSRVLDALRTRGFILKYVADGVEYGYVPSWGKHQIINNRESDSLLPDPANFPIESTTWTRESRVDDACPTPHEGKGREGKGKEGKGMEEGATRTRIAQPVFDLPDWINKTHWDAWHSCQKRKKASPAQKLLAIEKLNKWREAGQDYAGALENAAEGGWSALYLPGAQKAGKQTIAKPSQMTDHDRASFDQLETEKAKRLLFCDEPVIFEDDLIGLSHDQK